MNGWQATSSDIARRLRAAWSGGHPRNIGMAASNDLGDAMCALLGLLRPDALVRGPDIEQLELAFASFHGEGYRASTFSSGRIALSAILDALDIRPGDEVVVPAYTCVAVPNPVLFRGAVPIYADIDAATLNISWATISRVLSSRTRAVILQHTFGIPADATPIMEACRERNIAVIEDCTHALGATYRGQLVGTMGDAAFFSSEQTKVISTGSGGFTLTRDKNVADAIRQFQQNCAWPTESEVKGNLAYVVRLGVLENPWLQSLHLAFHYYFDRTGWFAPPLTTDEEFRSIKPKIFERRMSNGLARIGLRQVRALPGNLAHRRRIAGIYDHDLPGIGLRPVAIPAGSVPAYVRYPLRVPHKSQLLAYARDRNVHLGEWFSACVHPKGVDQIAAGYTPGSCPVAESALQDVINLPTHPRMSAADAHRVVDVIATHLSMHDHGHSAPP